ncbi:MAG TPA: ABC transporter substrate-binding protein [Candidatus Competibacteraceae bacterium]|nr:ABC transporter substrate-binding protein [Candidatus Competibacteraceae bacterium]
MSYKQLLASFAIAALTLVLIVGLIYFNQPGHQPQQTAAIAPAAPPPAATKASTTAPAPTTASVVPAHDLTIVSWGGDYQSNQRRAFFEPFTQSAGMPLVEAVFNGTLDEIKAGRAAGKTWDVADLEQSDVLKACQEGLLEPIDWSRIGNKADFMPFAVHDCGVGNIVWAFVMAYNPEKLPRAPLSWADLWDVQGLPGKRGLRKLAQWNLEIALLADGVPLKEVYTVLATPEGVDRAFNKLDQLRPHVEWWEDTVSYLDKLASGELVMSTGYNGDITYRRRSGQNVQILWNNIIYTLDYWVILKGSPNRDQAHQFIAFASQPQTQAEFARLSAFGPVVGPALNQLDAQLAPDLPTSPANLRFALATNAAFWNQRGAELEARFQKWLAQ